MSRCPGLYRRTQRVQLIHVPVVGVHIILNDLHGLEVFETGSFLYLVLPFIGVVLKVSHVGDVAHIPHLVSEMP